ncbi:5'-AMP-activated protein kinase, gamma subunit [Handroanthus impetiginosus]|uniref:5'-AMP-activated protein kinase, gamma subunit n=1 Tax=Handroanthus impetiginosus TaxID=429701 RepID=A0A2G9HYZ2_9LAMI|nr:5'-AMP-activated protein kinase, gamma subunit [Handroanthus impetiginosus]
MAVRLLAYEVADLCLGKPPLRSLSSSATVADALSALKSSDDSFISVWSCDHSGSLECECVCVGKVCMVDIICHLCRDENLSSPSLALKSPISVLLPEVKGSVRHVKPSSSLLEAIDLILEGAQNLVVPIKSGSTSNTRRKQLQKLSSSIAPTIHNGQEFCWLTQEDVIRFLFSSIGLFSQIATLSIDALGIISTEFFAVEYHRPASSAIKAISCSLLNQTSVAVVDEDGTLVGEISPFLLSCCDEKVAAAVMTLSAGDLMAYIDCGGLPEEVMKVVESRLKERNLKGMLNEFMISPCDGDISNSSYDEELPSPTTPLSRSGRYSRSSSHSARMLRQAEAIVCHPGSSLVAVMIQAITHRVNYVWVIEDDCSVVGIVTFANMLEVFRENLECMI